MPRGSCGKNGSHAETALYDDGKFIQSQRQGSFQFGQVLMVTCHVRQLFTENWLFYIGKHFGGLHNG